MRIVDEGERLVHALELVDLAAPFERIEPVQSFGNLFHRAAPILVRAHSPGKLPRLLNRAKGDVTLADFPHENLEGAMGRAGRRRDTKTLELAGLDDEQSCQACREPRALSCCCTGGPAKSLEANAGAPVAEPPAVVVLSTAASGEFHNSQASRSQTRRYR